MTTRLWRLSVLSALVAFFVIIAAPAAFAEAIGTISFLDGRVDILKAGQTIASTGVHGGHHQDEE